MMMSIVVVAGDGCYFRPLSYLMATACLLLAAVNCVVVTQTCAAQKYNTNANATK